MIRIPLTRVQFENSKQILRTNGIDWTVGTPNYGTVRHAGVTAEYSYSDESGVLTIQVTNRPFLVSLSAVETRIRQLFSQELSA